MTEKQLNQPCLTTNDAELFLIINFWIYAHCAADTLLEIERILVYLRQNKPHNGLKGTVVHRVSNVFKLRTT